ncbi:MAG: protein kinase [Gemmatimonadales bacterium]
MSDRYRLERELGAGGMANVYLADDLKHHRKVAIKVMRPELAAVIGAERFLAEIRTTANLQHPHILPLHDSGEVQGTVFYVMPYVEGESLRDRLDREQQLPVAEALRIVSEVAAALDYAHRHGVIHRDIKPENILLHDGSALVADFGIALAASRTEGGTRMTETGMSLGTPTYMSPEQAMGERTLDARTDIYALGCVLYESLVGEPPFTGPSAQAIIARVMTESPRSLTAQRTTVPPHVDAAMQVALAKLPADRFASAAEFAAALAGDASTSRYATAPAAVVVSPASRRWTLGALAVAALGIAFGAWGLTRDRSPTAAPSVAFTLDGTGPAAPSFRDVIRFGISISPDGMRIVYPGLRGGRDVLLLRELGSLDTRVLEGTEGALDQVFSPDGREVVFRRGTTLLRLALENTAPVVVAEIGQSPALYGLLWRADGMIYYLLEASRAIYRVPADGSAPPVPTPLPDSLGLISELNEVPGTEWLLTTQVRDAGAGAVLAISTRTGEVRSTKAIGLGARLTADGRHLLLGKPNGVVTLTAFDPDRLEVVGPEVAVHQGVQQTVIGLPSVSLATNGTLVYISGAGRERTIVEVTREGRERTLVGEPAEYKDPRWSPDRTRFAVEKVVGTAGDIWIHDTRAGTSTRLTNGSENLYPIWTPDGRRLVFTSRRSGLAGLWIQPADGGGEPEPLEQGAESMLRFPHAITADGTTLLIRTNAATTGMDIGAMALDGSTPPRDVMVTPDNEGSPTLSPDGRWMAYISDASGINEVYVTPWPDVGRRAQVSSGGGVEPQWNPQGGELFYRTGDALVAATLTARDGLLVPSRRDTLFTGNYFGQPRWPEYDVSADGERFLMLKEGEARQEIVVVTEWLRQAVAQLERDGGGQ